MPPATGTKYDGAPQAKGTEPPSAAFALHGADRGYHWPRWVIGPISIPYLEVLRGFWWVSRARAERRRGRRATGPQPGEDRGGEVPHVAKPSGGPLDGRRERVGSPEVGRRRSRRTPLACARPSRSTQAAADGDSPLHPVVSARDPPSPAPWLAPRSTCENARVTATMQLRSWSGAAAERLGGLTWRLSARLWLTAKGTTRS